MAGILWQAGGAMVLLDAMVGSSGRIIKADAGTVFALYIAKIVFRNVLYSIVNMHLNISIPNSHHCVILNH